MLDGAAAVPGFRVQLVEHFRGETAKHRESSGELGLHQSGSGGMLIPSPHINNATPSALLCFRGYLQFNSL